MDGLEKILDKLGVFNILAVFVPGLVIGTDVWLLHRIINVDAFFESRLEFVILSFVLGIVFYEIGYSFFTFIVRQDKILCNVIERKDKLQNSFHLKLCDYEYEKVIKYINKTTDGAENNNTENSTGKRVENNTADNSTDNAANNTGEQSVKKDVAISDVNWEGYRVYNYCKYRVREHRNNNSIVAMSRTLFVYFILVTLLAIILAICANSSSNCCDCICCNCISYDFKIWLYVAVHFALSIIFLIRTIRSYELMYATVIKEFYQSII